MNVTRTYSIVAGLATWFWGMIMGVMALNGARANGSSEAATRRWFAIGAGAMISLLPLVAQADISVPALNYDEAKARMAGLIAKFDARYAEVMSKHFSEHRDREEFIDEFFAILGWDVDNVRATALYAEDTIPEMRMRIGTTMHYADYGFRVASRTVFIAEAKGASHNIDDSHYIYQAKRYAWSSMRGNLAVLTDFETFRVYDARVRPDFDHPKQGELARFHLTYHDYVANFDLLWKTLSHQAVVEGSVQHLECLTQDEKDVFKTAFELDQRWVVELAADRTPEICQSQSVNIFLPGDVDKWDLHMLHWTAWERGIKSLYYCRSKSISRAGFAGQLEKKGAKVAAVSKTDYEECLACQ